MSVVVSVRWSEEVEFLFRVSSVERLNERVSAPLQKFLLLNALLDLVEFLLIKHARHPLPPSRAASTRNRGSAFRACAALRRRVAFGLINLHDLVVFFAGEDAQPVQVNLHRRAARELLI